MSSGSSSSGSPSGGLVSQLVGVVSEFSSLDPPMGSSVGLLLEKDKTERALIHLFLSKNTYWIFFHHLIS